MKEVLQDVRTALNEMRISLSIFMPGVLRLVFWVVMIFVMVGVVVWGFMHAPILTASIMATIMFGTWFYVEFSFARRERIRRGDWES